MWPQPPPPREKRHLYLVLNEFKDGCSIRQIDADSFDPDDTDDLDSRARALPDPVARVEARDSAMHFVALGTKILVLQSSLDGTGAAPALDTRTMAIAAGPLPRAEQKRQMSCESAFVTVGNDRIYSMDKRSRRLKQCNFEVLRMGSGGWSWSSVPSPPPFDPRFVTCYAVHPDERTISFSVAGDDDDLNFPYSTASAPHDDCATFSFDTETQEWTFRGYWTLPFVGEAHYDVELDAWVGFSSQYSDYGRVCSCDVLPPATGDQLADISLYAPAYKHCMDRLFRVKGRRHQGGGLVYMGDSTFCVLECATVLVDEPHRMHLYLRTFSLKYGKEGRLRVATCGRRARCYSLPQGIGCIGVRLVWSIRALWL